MTTEQLFEILKAQIDTATVPGLVSSQDVEEFIDLTREQTAILQEGWNRALQALNNLFAKRFGKDVVLIAFNGDTALPNDTRTNKAPAGARRLRQAGPGRRRRA